MTAPKLFAAVQHQICLDEDSSSLLAQAIRTPLSVIDDVEKAKHSQFREEIYFELIEERTKAGRPIALSPNRREPSFRALWAVLASRVCRWARWPSR